MMDLPSKRTRPPEFVADVNGKASLTRLTDPLEGSVMDQLLSLFLLIVAVTCVMVATQPVRPASRRRPRVVMPEAVSPDNSSATSTSPYRWGDTQRWSRRDIQQAIAREHAFPGGEGVWPPR